MNALFIFYEKCFRVEWDLMAIIRLKLRNGLTVSFHRFRVFFLMIIYVLKGMIMLQKMFY